MNMAIAQLRGIQFAEIIIFISRVRIRIRIGINFVFVAEEKYSD